ncbi:hypothetical protein MTBLM1_10391 [Rhodospirillaceae bacterium LM-1]|nr:hypothetical protein MTBLM1_10391 [Rhodospirillaceae bacterium LM-1]
MEDNGLRNPGLDFWISCVYKAPSHGGTPPENLRGVRWVGAVAEWLRSGLQNRVRRFNSGPCLQTK